MGVVSGCSLLEWPFFCAAANAVLLLIMMHGQSCAVHVRPSRPSRPTSCPLPTYHPSQTTQDAAADVDDRQMEIDALQGAATAGAENKGALLGKLDALQRQLAAAKVGRVRV